MKRALIAYNEAKKVGPYESAARSAGIEPVLACAGDDADLSGVSGLLLTGGVDVDPGLYGEERHPQTDEPVVERDRLEWRLIEEALQRDLPIFAICRGLQILNVQHGGTLIQHLDSTDRHRRRPQGDYKAGDPAHEIEIVADTLLSSIARTPRWAVNSRHHQAVGRVGNGLVVTARDDHDATVEALERPDKRFVLAVQWHPEDQAPVNEDQARLFLSFAQAL